MDAIECLVFTAAAAVIVDALQLLPTSEGIVLGVIRARYNLFSIWFAFGGDKGLIAEKCLCYTKSRYTVSLCEMPSLKTYSTRTLSCFYSKLVYQGKLSALQLESALIINIHQAVSIAEQL